MRDIAQIRKEYMMQSMSDADMSPDPIEQFARWWDDAGQSGIDEINAMTLATVEASGAPDARVVLLKGFDRNGFVFFTNYESRKARELDINPLACLVFYWKEIERQIRIEGKVEKVLPEESDEYFHSRPLGSRIGAWASPQSRVIESRDILDARRNELEARFEGKEVPRPSHWGGYRVIPVKMEFWQGRPNRLHDRILYSLGADGQWIRQRLAP